MTVAEWYPVLRFVLALVGFLVWSRITWLSYVRIRRQMTAQTRVRMMTIVFALTQLTLFLLISTIYTLIANPPPPQPFQALIGTAIGVDIAFIGWVIWRTYPRDENDGVR